jgi:WD40 repeat protein
MNVLSACFVPDPMSQFRLTIRDKETGRVFNKGSARVTHSGKVIALNRDPHNDEVVVSQEYAGNMKASPQEVSSTFLLTGFPSGEVGIWLSGFMMRTIQAHGTGPKIITADGTVTYGGVMAIKLRSDRTTLLTGGADGCVNAWNVAQTVDDQDWMQKVGDTVSVSDAGSGLSKSGSRRAQAGTTGGNASSVLGRGSVKMRKKEGVIWRLQTPFQEEATHAIRALDSLKGR